MKNNFSMRNFKKLFFKFSSIFILFLPAASTYTMEVAVTVDDLPITGDLPKNKTRKELAEKMLQVFEKHHLKNVYGLINGVNAQNYEGLSILKAWVNAGQLLGNHTYDHLDLAQAESESYIANIIKNETILKSIMKDKDYKYFRYPYLAEGNTSEKRDAVRNYLIKNEYKIAPVTVDFFEYEWNEPYVRCLEKKDEKAIAWLKKTYLEQAQNALIIAHELSVMLFNRDIKNVFLIHINAISTDMLDELLTLYEKNTIQFISLEDALKDKVYAINTNVVRDRTYTFLNQVRIMKNMENPEIVNKLYDSLPEAELEQICK